MLLSPRPYLKRSRGVSARRPDTISRKQERVVMERGLEALKRTASVRPVGYRSPAWEITPTTLELLGELGFLYDSSGMGDDIPYVERHGERSIVELPVQWLLDDWPQFGYGIDGGGQIAWSRDEETVLPSLAPCSARVLWPS